MSSISPEWGDEAKAEAKASALAAAKAEAKSEAKAETWYYRNTIGML